MRRLVALSRVCVIGLVLMLALTACGSATPNTQPGKPVASKAAGTDGDTGSNAAAPNPVLGSACNQNTPGDNTPDNSATAFLAGGGATIQAMVAKMDNEAKNNVDVYTKYGGSGGAILPIIPAPRLVNGSFKTVYQSPINRVVKGVICPNGDIYLSGNPTKWMSGAWLINRDPGGTVENQSSSVLFGHPAAQVLKVPCAALLQDTRTPQMAPNPAYKRGVCTNGTAVFLYNHLYNQ
jgi:hypothetical protein